MLNSHLNMPDDNEVSITEVNLKDCKDKLKFVKDHKEIYESDPEFVHNCIKTHTELVLIEREF